MGYPIPSADGGVNIYANREAKSTRFWQSNRYVFFINGMSNSAQDHMQSAVALSKLQMCQVIGIYNKTSGTVSDLLQCLGDKWQWDGAGLDRAFNEARTKYLEWFGTPAAAERAILSALSRNAAAPALFTQLRRRPGNVEIFAHSQGNLILSNVLTAIKILVGKNSMTRFTVHSYGSPTVNWPKGITHYKHGFTFDPVNWLAGFDSSFSISKVGVPTNSDALGVVSHSFKSYMQDDATFVVNRFRWGSFGLTASMDEEGLASALDNMGTNIPRVRAIFERLYSAHWSDVDDVAVLYVHKIKNKPAVLNLVKRDTKLSKLLIKSLDEGWTSKAEYEAIDLIKP